MADLFSVFDGRILAGRGASQDSQNGLSFSDVEPENDALDTLSTGSSGVELKVDYSDFANFVTFNSAESYVTITADKILNEYPLGGTVDDREQFMASLDGYQRYFLAGWPSSIGHLRFNPASGSYVSFNDVGVQDEAARTSFVSPGTGSLSLCLWLHAPALTGSNDVMPVFQKTTASGDGLLAYLTGSQFRFRLVSGTTTAEVSASLAEMPSFVSSIVDRGSGLLAICVGTTGTFPVVHDSASLSLGARYDLASGSFYLASGTLATKSAIKFTGSIDDVSIWSSVRGVAELTSSYNRKLFAQSGLLAAWRFDEALSTTSTPAATIVRDCSGHRVDGRIQAYFPQIRGSGSFAYDRPDPVLLLDEPSVMTYVLTAQSSGSTYDRQNDSLVFNLFPQAFLDTDDAGTFSTIALTMARHFDRIKVAVEHLVKTMRVDYGDLDDAPDALLSELGSFLGWQDTGGFSGADAMRFFFGRGVAPGPASNFDQDTTMAEIRSQFMRRALLNVMHLHKSRGTRESVESLMRVRGIDPNVFRLKEYARRVESRMQLERVISEKSVNVLRFMSGSTVSFVAR